MKGFLLFIAVLVFMVGCTTRTSVPTTNPPTTLPTQLVPTALRGTVTPQTVPTTPTTPTTEPRSNLGETKTYRDEYAGFEFDYPASWNLTPIAEEAKANSYIYAATFFSFTRTVPSAEGIPEGETKIDVGVFKNDAASAQAALELRKQEFASSDLEQKILSEEMWTLPSGMQAARIQVQDRFGESAEMLTTINGRTILFGGVGDYKLFDAIARTLRPL